MAKSSVDHDSAAARQPERTCAGCREQSGSSELLRFAFVPQHTPVLIPDLSGRLGGRGTWVHPRIACVAAAQRAGFARALKCAVQVDRAELLALARAQLVRRIEGLFLAARRRGWVAEGTDAVLAVLAEGSPARGGASRDGSPARGRASTAPCRVSILLVAKDAAGRRNELVARASEWRVEVVELFDKAALGRLSGRQELGFVAVLEPRIAHEISDSARWLAGLSEDG